MAETIKLSELEERLGRLSYPIDKEEATEHLGDTTLELADGETMLGETVARSGADRFDSAADLASEVRSTLPREAVGEPYQSEGEG